MFLLSILSHPSPWGEAVDMVLVENAQRGQSKPELVKETQLYHQLRGHALPRLSNVSWTWKSVGPQRYSGLPDVVAGTHAHYCVCQVHSRNANMYWINHLLWWTILLSFWHIKLPFIILMCKHSISIHKFMYLIYQCLL